MAGWHVCVWQVCEKVVAVWQEVWQALGLVLAVEGVHDPVLTTGQGDGGQPNQALSLRRLQQARMQSG